MKTTKIPQGLGKRLSFSAFETEPGGAVETNITLLELKKQDKAKAAPSATPEEKAAISASSRGAARKK